MLKATNAVSSFSFSVEAWLPTYMREVPGRVHSTVWFRPRLSSVGLVSHPLDGARLKLERAETHRKMLNQEFQHYWSTNAHEVVFETDAQAGLAVMRVRVNRPPEPLWSVIVGEFLHNVRSALDALAWELAVKNEGAPPSPLPIGNAGRAWKGTQFPIFTNARAYGAASPQMLALLEPADQARFEAEQPYHKGGAADAQPLSLLRELSNIDKHRHIHLTTGHLWNQERYVSSIQASNCNVLDVVVSAAPGPIADGTELGRVRFEATGTNPSIRLGHSFVFGVTFAEPTLTWHPTIDTLDVLTAIGTTVRGIIERFSPRFP